MTNTFYNQIINNIKRNKTKRALQFLKVVKAFLIVGLVFVIIMPYVKIFIDSIKGSGDTASNLVYWIPSKPTFRKIKSSYLELIRGRVYYNTFILCIITTIIQVIVTAIYGYAFARLKFKGSNILFWVIMFILVVPRETLEVSRTLFMANYSFFNVYLMQSKNSIYLMTLFGMGNFSPIFIYIFRQYFKSISKDIEEQANIDGAGIFRTFWRIMLPNAKGAILTVGLLSFVWTYNDSYYPSLFNFSTNSFELLSTKLVNGRYSNINTTALLIIIPLLLIYIVTQKHFIEAIEKSIIY